MSAKKFVQRNFATTSNAQLQSHPSKADFLRSSKIFFTYLVRVAEVAGEHGWLPPKSLDSDENLNHNIRYFVAILRFVAFYTLFGRSGKKVLFGSKTVFLSEARSAL